jgi:hypothetical protein
MSEVAEKKWVVAEGEKVIGREFRFAFHIPSHDQDIPDYHFVKEQVHYEVDGKVVVRPTLRLIPNFQRPVYFTKPTKRTHKEKKEVESLDNLMRIDCRQSDLKRVIAKMTNDFGGFKSLRDLCASPYVYAADIPSTLFLRRELYDDKYPNLLTPRTVATFDTETNMFTPEKETITSSTAYDHKWINGRNIFDSIDRIVDELFENYLSRPNVRQPILTQYCDGQRVTCSNWLSQWGSKYLGDQNYETIEILRYYYGDNMFINTAEEISGIPASWPRYNLEVGAAGDKVRQIQEQLARISQAYPAIPTITPDGIYGEATKAAVEKFQSIFGLPVTGVVDYRTWYKISEIYVAVTRIAELV